MSRSPSAGTTNRCSRLYPGERRGWDEHAYVWGCARQDVVVEALFGVDEVDGILDFRELLDQPRPLAGEHLLAFGDGRLVEERKGRE